MTLSFFSLFLISFLLSSSLSTFFPFDFNHNESHCFSILSSLSTGELPVIQLGHWKTNVNERLEEILRIPIDPHEIHMDRFISSWDLISLNPSRRINDAAMSALIRLVEQISDESTIISLYQSLKLISGGKVESLFPSLLSQSKILFPILWNSHYLLLEINLERHEILGFDSLESNPLSVESIRFDSFESDILPVKEIRAVLSNWSIQSNLFQYQWVSCPSQLGSNDCGINLVLNLISRRLNKAPNYHYESEEIRFKFKQMILNGNLDIEYLQTAVLK